MAVMLLNRTLTEERGISEEGTEISCNHHCTERKFSINFYFFFIFFECFFLAFFLPKLPEKNPKSNKKEK